MLYHQLEGDRGGEVLSVYGYHTVLIVAAVRG